MGARLLLCLGLLLAAPAAAEPVDLVGTWHVLVHYRDAASNKPQQERWEDRLWVIEREGTRLKWTKYPIVVFDDASGRFERLGTNRASRVLAFWEPNPGQLAEIEAGLEYNTRGSKSKTLRGSDAEGWTSSKKQGYQSARFITYSETWQISGSPELPRFQRDDSMGAAGAESVEGRTLYETEQVEAGGRVLRGRFERDGSRSGSFRMTRSGAASTVKGSGKSQGQRVQELFFGEMAGQLFAEGVSGTTPEEQLQRMIEAGDVPDEVRSEVRQELRRFIEEQYRAQGNDPRAFTPQIQSLSRRIERLYLDEGKSLEEIREMLASGELRP